MSGAITLSFLSPVTKIMTLQKALEWRGAVATEGLRLAVTNGCFDILHRGHAEYLFEARKLADCLMVLLNSDASVRSLKGSSRPVNKETDRAFILASLGFVDAVLVFGEPRCTEIFRILKPDVYVKGGDYNIDTINEEEKQALLESGAQISFIPLVPGYSTTAIIKDSL
ncbi:MAG: adenylyltransferase/cytidyltransferase family protein [Victivallales bacterium]|nr:adenylyltransferase/cytidyltransferase family protein [Victivallales bacterium]